MCLFPRLCLCLFLFSVTVSDSVSISFFFYVSFFFSFLKNLYFILFFLSVSAFVSYSRAAGLAREVGRGLQTHSVDGLPRPRIPVREKAQRLPGKVRHAAGSMHPYPGPQCARCLVEFPSSVFVVFCHVRTAKCSVRLNDLMYFYLGNWAWGARTKQ